MSIVCTVYSFAVETSTIITIKLPQLLLQQFKRFSKDIYQNVQKSWFSDIKSAVSVFSLKEDFLN